MPCAAWGFVMAKNDKYINMILLVVCVKARFNIVIIGMQKSLLTLLVSMEVNF